MQYDDENNDQEQIEDKPTRKATSRLLKGIANPMTGLTPEQENEVNWKLTPENPYTMLVNGYPMAIPGQENLAKMKQEHMSLIDPVTLNRKRLVEEPKTAINLVKAMRKLGIGKTDEFNIFKMNGEDFMNATYSNSSPTDLSQALQKEYEAYSGDNYKDNNEFLSMVTKNAGIVNEIRNKEIQLNNEKMNYSRYKLAQEREKIKKSQMPNDFKLITLRIANKAVEVLDNPKKNKYEYEVPPPKWSPWEKNYYNNPEKKEGKPSGKPSIWQGIQRVFSTK